MGLTVATALTAFDAGTAAAGAGEPDPPANLRVEGLAPDRFTVAWDPVTGAAEYKVTVIPLEPPGEYRRTGTEDTAITLQNLAPDVPYKVTVRAFVPSAYPSSYSESSTILVTTPLPEGYVPPSAPADLRLERDASGAITLVRWDAPTQHFGPLSYRIHLESTDLAELTGIWGHTSGLSFDAGLLPITGGILGPGQSVTMWVTATDQVYNQSPPSQAVVLTCCPL
jgi:hypothetical protein